MSDPTQPPRFASMETARWLATGLGFAVIGLLAWAPSVGLHVVWNGLVPVLPAVVMFAPGVWRNVCPLGTVTVLAGGVRRHRGRMSKAMSTWFGWGSISLLLLLVPLRHVVFDLSASATMLLLVGAAAVAVALAIRYEGRSGWCNGLCPVNAVERLYGVFSRVAPRNIQCSPCVGCVSSCPDVAPLQIPRRSDEVLAGLFPGFVWGWFHVPNFTGSTGWSHLLLVYGLPLASASATLAIFMVLARGFTIEQRPRVVHAFAVTAACLYYVFRLPALIGFGVFPGDGMLIDLQGELPPWTPALLQIGAVAILVGAVGLAATDRHEGLPRAAWCRAAR